jgi:hypothetical protein
METNIDNSFNNDLSATPARPQFLSVLCILSWVMCGIMLISSLFGIVAKPSADAQKEQIEQIRQFNPEAAVQMEAVLAEQSGSGQVLSTILGLLAVGLSFYGVLMMWKLKKTGFYLYIVGELLPYIGMMFGGAAAMSVLSAMGSAAQTAGTILIALMLIVDIVFIVLYGLNIKHMNK